MEGIIPPIQSQTAIIILYSHYKVVQSQAEKKTNPKPSSLIAILAEKRPIQSRHCDFGRLIHFYRYLTMIEGYPRQNICENMEIYQHCKNWFNQSFFFWDRNFSNCNIVHSKLTLAHYSRIFLITSAELYKRKPYITKNLIPYKTYVSLAFQIILVGHVTTEFPDNDMVPKVFHNHTMPADAFY